MRCARRDRSPNGPFVDLCRRGTTAARGAVQPRADGAAWTGAGRVAPAEHAARHRRAPHSAGAERDPARYRPRAPDGGRERRPAHHSGRRVAARQLLPDRGTDSNGAAPPPGGLQPRAAAPGRRPVGRAAARLRHRARNDLARGRPPGHGGPRRFCLGLPVGDAPHHGRVVGHPDHAAAGPARKPAPRRRPDRGRSRGPEPRRLLGRPDDGGRGERPEEPHPVDRRHGAVGPADGGIVRRRVRPPPAGQEPGAGPGTHLDRTAAVRGRPDYRAPGAVGEPASGRRPGLDQQQHRQPEVPRGRRLARLRRGEERRGADVAGGPGRRLRPDGLRHARPVPPRRGIGCQAERADGNRGGPARDRPRPRDGGSRRSRCEDDARRVLPRRQGAPATRTFGPGALLGVRRGAPRLPPPPADVLSRRRGGADAAARCGPDRESARRGRRRLAARVARRRPVAVRQPGGRRHRECAGVAAGDGPRVAENGSVGRSSRGLSHAGRRPDAHHQRAGRGADGRGPGGALPGKPRRPHRLRPPHGPRRCSRGDPAGRRTPRAPRRSAHRRTQRQVRAFVLPVPPAAALESRGTGLDGIRAQAGEAGRSECAAPRPRERPLLEDRRRHQHSPAGEVRHHPRCGHPIAAGRRPAPRRRDDAPAQPRAVRRAEAARDRGLRHPPAARGRQPHRRAQVAVRAAVDERARHRSVYPRRLRRLPGPVQRRLLHRQGHLRRGCVRTGGGRPLPGEPDPQPRPDRGVLRARRSPDRRPGVRGAPVPL